MTSQWVESFCIKVQKSKAGQHSPVVTSTRSKGTAATRQKSTPSTSPMWSEAWPPSAAAVPWAPPKATRRASPAQRDTTWWAGPGSARAASQTASSGPRIPSESRPACPADPTRRETRWRQDVNEWMSWHLHCSVIVLGYCKQTYVPNCVNQD